MREIWRFSQGENLPARNAGVCMTLVALWISMMRDNKSDANESGAEAMKSACAFEARKLQNFYSKRFNADETLTWGLRNLKLEGPYEPCESEEDVKAAFNDKRSGYSIGIYFHGGGGHALGVWRSGRSSGFGSSLSGHTYFFDPNFGCYKGDTGGFASWLNEFLARDYPDTRTVEIAKVVPLGEGSTHIRGGFRYT